MKNAWSFGITSLLVLSSCAGKTVLLGEEGSGALSGESSGMGGSQSSGGATTTLVTATGGATTGSTTTGGTTGNAEPASKVGGGFPNVSAEPADAQGCVGGSAVTLPPSILAARMALFLYQGVPDAELLAAANFGALSTTAGIACQARRMLGAPAAANGVQELFRAWLGYTPTPSPDTAYGVDAATRLLMVEETDTFSNHVFFSPASSFEELLTAPYSFLNAALAQHYGAMFPASQQGFAQVSFQQEQRSGVLTQGLFLTTTPDHVNITKRGNWITTQFRCAGAAPSPPGIVIPLSPPPGSGRDRLAVATAAPGCAGCHRAVDPLGFGLGYFDEQGLLRTSDLGYPIDASGSLENWDGNTPTVFVGAPGLGQALSNDPATLDCAAKQVMAQALRSFIPPNPRMGAAEAPESTLASMRAVFEGTGKNMKELVIAAVTTPEFLAP